MNLLKIFRAAALVSAALLGTPAAAQQDAPQNVPPEFTINTSGWSGGAQIQDGLFLSCSVQRPYDEGRALFLALILTLIGSLKVFGQIYVMTGGGPGTSTYVLVFYIFQQAFRLYEFGYASAIAFILFFIVLLLTLAQWWMRKKWVFHEQ